MLPVCIRSICNSLPLRLSSLESFFPTVVSGVFVAWVFVARLRCSVMLGHAGALPRPPLIRARSPSLPPSLSWFLELRLLLRTRVAVCGLCSRHVYGVTWSRWSSRDCGLTCGQISSRIQTSISHPHLIDCAQLSICCNQRDSQKGLLVHCTSASFLYRYNAVSFRVATDLNPN